jgi:hypothetical protein
MSLILIVLVVLLVGGFYYYPRQGYKAPSYAPFSLGGLLVIILLLYLLGVIHV